MAWFNGSSALLLVTLVLFTVTICDAFKTRYVRVTNNLEGGQTLSLHCKSEDDDLGLQTLATNASFEFHFKPSFITITKFDCSFEWPGASHWFEIYNHEREKVYCSKCYWSVTTAAPCRYDWDEQKKTSMASFTGNTLLLVLLIFFTMTMFCAGVGSRRCIKVTNDLGENSTLTVHCKSKNDDIGEKVLALHDWFEFSFRPNVWDSTLYYCSFAWPNNFKWFDIYIDKRDRDDCRLCYYSVVPNGPCRFNFDTNKYDNCFKWN
ncbi:hypothetical protein PS1_046272 [Malus domestica]